MEVDASRFVQRVSSSRRFPDCSTMMKSTLIALPKTTCAVPPLGVTSAVIATSPGFWQRHHRLMGPGPLADGCESCTIRFASLGVTGQVAMFVLLQGCASGDGPGTIPRATARMAAWVTGEGVTGV